MKKYYIFSDVHGAYDELMLGLKNSGFDINNENHIIISCGDAFDRGNQNYEVYKFLNDLPKERKFLIRGNHEVMLKRVVQQAKTGKIVNNSSAVKTYLEFREKFKDDQIKEVINFIDETINYVEIAGHIFVHGCIPSVYYKTDPQELWDEAYWVNTLEVFTKLPKMNKTIVVGHVYAKKFHGLHEIYFIPKSKNKCGFIAVDSGTVDSFKVNILVMNEDGTYENEILRNVIKQLQYK